MKKITYDAKSGQMFETELDADDVITEVYVKTIPDCVTMRQARRALLDSGKYLLVDEIISQLPEPLKTQVKIDWEYAQVIYRNSPTVKILQDGLKLSDSDLDELFIMASNYD